MVVGAPGSGKTTFCHGLHQFLEALGVGHKTVNLDPASEFAPFDFDIDVRPDVCVKSVMQEEGLGPNGAALRAMELVEERFSRLVPVEAGQLYIFDLPGQVELFTGHDSLRRIVYQLQRKAVSCVAVSIADATSCQDRNRYVATLILTLKTMLYLEMPHVSIMSKIDLVHSEWIMPMDEACSGDGLQYLELDSLGVALRELIDAFGLMNFIPISVQDKECMAYVWHELQLVTTGIAVQALEGADGSSVAAQSPAWRQGYMERMQERYAGYSESGGNKKDT